MKKLITLIIVAGLALTIQAQNITNTQSATGDFLVNKSDATNYFKVDKDGYIYFPGIADGSAEKALLIEALTGKLILGTSTSAFGIDNLTDGVASNYTVALGLNAGNNGLGAFNVAVGLDALKIATGGDNVAVGANAGLALTSGVSNTFLGGAAGILATGDNNIAVGKAALGALTTGNDNIKIGVGAGNITTGNKNIVIGTLSTIVPSQNADGQLNIGETIYATGMYTDTVKVGIGAGNSAPTSILDVGGSMELPVALENVDYTINDTDYTIVVGGSSHTITLPTPVQGRIYVIKNGGTATNTTIEATTGKSIDGSQTVILTAAYDYIMLQAVGTTQWIIISKN